MSTGWKKWECPPDMFTVEQRLQTLQLTDDQTDMMALAYYEVEMLRSKDSDIRQKWAAQYVKTQAKMIKKDLKEGFVEDFQLWLQGRSKYCQKTISIPVKDKMGKTTVVKREATPWGNKGLLHLPEVKEWLSKPILNRDKVIKKVAELKLGPLQGIEDSWLFYKYITRAVAVDGDIIKEQRGFNVFDYMENRPMKLDEEGNYVPDERYTPLSMENPSMPRFDAAEYGKIYDGLMHYAVDGDSMVLHTPEYDTLMPGDKLMILSVLSENAEKPTPFEPKRTAFSEFLVDRIERAALVAKAPVPPAGIKIEKEDKDYDEAAKREEKRLKKEADKKKRAEKVAEKAKRVLEEIKVAKGKPEIREEAVAPIKEAVIKKKDTVREEMAKLKGPDPIEKTAPKIREKMDLFADLKVDLDAYRSLNRRMNSKQKPEEYDEEMGDYHDYNAIPGDEDGEGISEFETWALRIIGGKDEMNENLATRTSIDSYFTGFFRKMSDAVGDGMTTDEAAEYALERVSPPSEYRAALDKTFRGLMSASPMFKHIIKATPLEDEPHVRDTFMGLSQIALNIKDPVQVRFGLEKIMDSISLSTMTSPYLRKARGVLQTLKDRDGAINQHFLSLAKKGEVTDDYLQMEGPIRQLALMESIFEGKEESIGKVNPVLVKDEIKKTLESIPLPDKPSWAGAEYLDFRTVSAYVADDFDGVFGYEDRSTLLTDEFKREYLGGLEKRLNHFKTVLEMPSKSVVSRMEALMKKHVKIGFIPKISGNNS